MSEIMSAEEKKDFLEKAIQAAKGHINQTVQEASELEAAHCKGLIAKDVFLKSILGSVSPRRRRKPLSPSRPSQKKEPSTEPAVIQPEPQPDQTALKTSKAQVASSLIASLAPYLGSNRNVQERVAYEAALSCIVKFFNEE